MADWNPDAVAVVRTVIRDLDLPLEDYGVGKVCMHGQTAKRLHEGTVHIGALDGRQLTVAIGIQQVDVSHV
jgi:hypothetical protein